MRFIDQISYPVKKCKAETEKLQKKDANNQLLCIVTIACASARVHCRLPQIYMCREDAAFATSLTLKSIDVTT